MKVCLPAGTLVEIWKLSASENPIEEPSSWEQWVPGSGNNSGSLPVGYAIRGILMGSIRVGQGLDVYRIERNGVRAHGHFKTTPVIAIHDGLIAETFNSIFRITPVVINISEEDMK